MLEYQLRFVLSEEIEEDTTQAIVILDTPPLKRVRQAIEKRVKETLAATLPTPVSHRFWTHQSRSHYGLQVADYYSWAVFRKYEALDTDAYNRIASAISSEFEIFSQSSRRYY